MSLLRKVWLNSPSSASTLSSLKKWEARLISQLISAQSSFSLKRKRSQLLLANSRLILNKVLFAGYYAVPLNLHSMCELTNLSTKV